MTEPLTPEELTPNELKTFSKLFDRPEVPEFMPGLWYEIDGSYGITFYPACFFTKERAGADYAGDIHKVTERPGVGVRLQRPGYPDATDWVVFDTLEEAQRYLIETYGD